MPSNLVFTSDAANLQYQATPLKNLLWIRSFVSSFPDAWIWLGPTMILLCMKMEFFFRLPIFDPFCLPPDFLTSGQILFEKMDRWLELIYVCCGRGFRAWEAFITLDTIILEGHRPVSLKLTFTQNKVPIPRMSRVTIPQNLPQIDKAI